MTHDPTCPRCGSALDPRQGWCSECGLAVSTRLSAAPRWRGVLGIAGALGALALVALIASFVLVTDDDAPVKAAATTATTAGPTPTQERGQRLRRCVGSVTADVPAFAATAKLARDQGGDAFAATVSGQPVMLIVYPTPAAAQVGFKDASDRLVTLQQQDPKAYAAVAATKTQVVGEVLEIHPAGALAPPAAAKVSGCIAAG